MTILCFSLLYFFVFFFINSSNKSADIDTRYFWAGYSVQHRPFLELLNPTRIASLQSGNVTQGTSFFKRLPKGRCETFNSRRWKQLCTNSEQYWDKVFYRHYACIRKGKAIRGRQKNRFTLQNMCLEIRYSNWI